MGMIVGGIGIAGYGLLPRDVAAQVRSVHTIAIAAPADGALTPTHWRLMVVLVIALAIDVLKPASLGFVMPGMIDEYGVPAAQAALVPFFALMGTVVGSVAWGVLADIYGRKAAILLSAIMFVGTSICGAMPSLAWNIGMCFLMGAAAGGMLPVAYALLAETIPSRHRGWAMVLVGGLGAVGGYFAASGFSALLLPWFGWRILWLLNLPTGLLLLAMGGLIPESARFLIARGRQDEAAKVMAQFGTAARQPATAAPRRSDHPVSLAGTTVALSMAGLAWGLANFGLVLWLPGELVARGHSMAASSALLARSALLAFPTVFLVALAYGRWSTRGTLLAMIAITLAGLGGVLLIDHMPGLDPVAPIALLIVGSNGLLAVLLPYAAECYPLAIRARATGWVAACTKLGGLGAQALGIAGLVPPLGVVATAIMLPLGAGLVLSAIFARETRGADIDVTDASTD
jgi:putative MFS transporter